MTPSEIKPGNIFNKWEVIKFDCKDKGGNKKFFCKCLICGKVRSVRGSKLIHGESQSCSKACSNTNIGERFGRWTVISIDKSRPKYKIVRCDCGTIKSVVSSSLKNGQSKSCGCLRQELSRELMIDLNKNSHDRHLSSAEDNIGLKLGKLTITKPVYHEGRKQFDYLCKCECGSTLTVRGSHLFSGHTVSCGCINSKANMKMDEILRKHNIPFKREYRLDGCRDKAPLPFDFAIFNKEEELIGLIENNGSQHYASRGTGWDTPQRTIKTQRRDYIKQLFAEENQIPLLIIPYQYFPQIEKFLLTSDFWKIINLKLQRLSAYLQDSEDCE